MPANDDAFSLAISFAGDAPCFARQLNVTW
jgi:hypothetical protein